MTTDTDKIRKKFNQWNDPLNYNPYRTSELVEMAYLEAYQQGQRDLIEAMGEPVAYIHHHKGGDNLEWDSPGVNYSPLYRLPEGAQK